MHYYEVAPMLIVRKDSDVFTYQSDTHLETGTIVLIPVGKREVVGIVTKPVSKPAYDTKPVILCVEPTPLPKELLSLSLWMRSYYYSHLSQTLQLLVPRGVQKKRQQRKNKLKSAPIRNRTKIVFNKHQLAALEVIDRMSSGTALLHGVTGSGKTAVYLETSRWALADGKSVIVLVPEISLTSQIVDEFSSHFDNVYLTHSQQTEAQRHDTWSRVLNDSAPKIIIGPRSALFLPVNNIGLIIIDEAHEPSYKQEQSPRYSALRVASVLAAEHSAKLILGSATPSVMDYYLADQRPSSLISMPETAKPSKPPVIRLVDMTKHENFSRHRFFSDMMIQQTEQTLASKHQVLFFHNRRGSASIALCEQCGWQAGCQRCFVPLSLHADSYELRCHICGYHERVPGNCPSCHNSSIIYKGIGTKMIESELQKLFPKAHIARFDGDSSSDDTISNRYKELYDGSIDIVIGTQVVAKGLDLPRLRMVGIVQADTGLFLPDFSSQERTFQLLTQAVGRVGRTDDETTVVVQSFHSGHPAIVDGLKGDYPSFYRSELAQRQRSKFPPFRYLLRLVCVYKTERSAVNNAQALAKTLKQSLPSTVEILGPTPAFYERQRDTYRWQLVLKSKKRADLLLALDQLPPTHWQFELDPTNLL